MELKNYIITACLMIALILACRAWVNRTQTKINWGLILCCLGSAAIVMWFLIKATGV